MDLTGVADRDSAGGGNWARRLSRGNALLLGALATHTVEHLVRQPSGPASRELGTWRTSQPVAEPAEEARAYA